MSPTGPTAILALSPVLLGGLAGLIGALGVLAIASALRRRRPTLLVRLDPYVHQRAARARGRRWSTTMKRSSSLPPPTPTPAPPQRRAPHRARSPPGPRPASCSPSPRSRSPLPEYPESLTGTPPTQEQIRRQPDRKAWVLTLT